MNNQYGRSGKPWYISRRGAALPLFVICVLVVAVQGTYTRARGEKSLEQRIAQIKPRVHDKVEKMFFNAGCGFPGSSLSFLALKKEKTLEVWCSKPDKKYSILRKYRILAASGGPGPKLKEGDRQVPEGIYKITWLHPNSSFHLSMKLNYPNELDKARAGEEGRKDLGGDIFIHGSFVSAGCLAMGDGPIEEIFYMTHVAGLKKSRVIIMPYDFRKNPPKAPDGAPKWTGDLYKTIDGHLAPFRS